MTSVVVTPPKNLGGIYRDNRIWARQYVAHRPDERSIVQLKESTPEAVLAATRAAVIKAGRDGEIIYAVGHGGSGASAVAGQVDFAPKRKFRVSQFLAYYNDLSGTWAGPSIPDMQSELREADALKGKKKAKARKAWCGEHIAEACKKSQGQVRDIRKLQPHYEELRDIFEDNPVRRIVLLTCNVGNATDFLTELATDLTVRVTAYTERVVSRWEKKDGKTRVWMYLEGDREGHGTNIDSAAWQLLPGRRSDQVVHGRVRARRKQRGRRSRVPVID